MDKELLIDAMYQYVVSAVVADKPDLAKEQLMALQKIDYSHWKSRALTELILSDEQSENSPLAPKKIYLLLVGIDNYKNIRPLMGGVNDVKLFNRTLHSIYAASAFEVHSLILTDQEATYLKVNEAFNFIQTNAKENDIVLFYFSGSVGKNLWKNQNEKYTFFLFDTESDFNKNEYFLSRTEIHNRMKAVETTSKFVVLDTLADEFWLEQVKIDGDYTLMFGCSEGEYPKEKTFSNGSNETHGSFTGTLIALVDENRGEDIDVKFFYTQLNERLVNDGQKPSIIGDIIPLFFPNYRHKIIEPKELMKHLLNPLAELPEEYHKYISRKFQQGKFICLPLVPKFVRTLIKSRELKRAANYYTDYTHFEDSLENLIKIVLLNEKMGDFVKAESLLSEWLNRHPEIQAQHPARELLKKYRTYLQDDNRYALLIGISQYQRLDTFKSGSKNAQLWFTHLKETLGFKPENIVMLIDEQASRQSIIEQYLKFAKLAEKYPVLFFFSGYGTSYELDKLEIEQAKDLASSTVYETYEHKCIPAILSNDARGHNIPDILFSELNQVSHGKHLVSIFDMGIKEKLGGYSPNDQMIKKRDSVGFFDDYVYVNVADALLYPVGKASLLPGVLNKNQINEKKKVWYAENEEGGVFTQSILKILSDPSQRFSLSELSKTISRKRVNYSLETSGYYLSPTILGEEDVPLFAPYQFGQMEITKIINSPLLELQHKLNQLSASLSEDFPDTQVISSIIDAYIGDAKLASSKLGPAAADEKQELRRYVKANYHLGKFLVETSAPNDNGAWSQAVNVLRTYHEMEPNFKPTYYYLGKAINQLFQIEGRVNAANSFQQYAASGYPIGKKEEVEAFLDNLDDQRLKKRRLEEGLSLLSKSEYREAEQCLQEAFNLGEISAQYHLGVLFEKQSEQLRALNAYQLAITLGVKTDDLNYKLGNILRIILQQGVLLKETIKALGDENNVNLDSRNEKLIHDLGKLKEVLSQVDLKDSSETGSSR